MPQKANVGMYSSHYLHKNLGTTYITIGDPYINQGGNPFRQPKKGDPIPKPMLMERYPRNADGNGNFTKIEYPKDKNGYNEATRYLQTQPLDKRKLGFGTKDAFKSDEFTNGIRTQQYRESIVKEMTKQKEKGGKAYEALLEKYDVQDKSNNQPRINQYDIGRNRITPFDAKSVKDTFYKFDDSKGKKMGMYRPVSCDVGSEAWTTKYKPPENGGTSEVKKFYDRSHLTVNRSSYAI
jgi:hypothetical protein